jgi:hypothetical protein
MTAINTNNQIVKFDYPIKDLRENVEVKQKELSHELDSTPIKRENYCRENEIVLKEPLKLDKESIVSLQEEKSSLKTKTVHHFLFPFQNLSLKNDINDISSFVKDDFKGIIDNNTMDVDEIFQRWVEWENISFVRDSLKREEYFRENREKEYKLFGSPYVWKAVTWKVDITGRKATYSVLDDYSGVFKVNHTIEVSENNKNIFIIMDFPKTEFEDFYLIDNISSNSIENKIEENTFSSSSSHFLDEYLKQKDFSNQFLIHQLIDNKLLKNLNLIV